MAAMTNLEAQALTDLDGGTFDLDFFYGVDGWDAVRADNAWALANGLNPHTGPYLTADQLVTGLENL